MVCRVLVRGAAVCLSRALPKTRQGALQAHVFMCAGDFLARRFQQSPTQKRDFKARRYFRADFYKSPVLAYTSLRFFAMILSLEMPD